MTSKDLHTQVDSGSVGVTTDQEDTKMKFTYTIEVEVERSEGKFASREDLGDQIKDAIEEADPGDLTGENDGQYTTIQWEVEEAS